MPKLNETGVIEEIYKRQMPRLLERMKQIRWRVGSFGSSASIRWSASSSFNPDL
jgi:hypothetical protein